MIDVSIIIVNYNTSSLVNDAIESIYDNTKNVTFEIIVVDNNTERLNDTIKLASRPEVKLLQLNDNIGFGKANNAGLELASGRNILFLNPDTKLINNAVEILSNYLDKHPACGACGGNLFDVDMNPTRSFRRIFPSMESLIATTFIGGLYEHHKSGGIMLFNHTESPIGVAYIVGADLMVKREILKKYGAFNPAFFMYYEEIELCHRIKRAGFKILNIPQARIQHLEGKTGTIGERKARLHYQSAQTYFKLTLDDKEFTKYRKVLKHVINIRLVIGRITHKKNMVNFWSTWKTLYNQDKAISQ